MGLDSLQQFSVALAQTVKAIRLEKGLSKNKLSETSGLSRSAITFIESNAREPAAVTLLRLSKGLNMPLWELIKRAEQLSNQSAST